MAKTLNIDPLEVIDEKYFNSHYLQYIETISLNNKYINIKGLFLTKPFKDKEVRAIYNSYVKYNFNKINKEKILIFSNKNEYEYKKLKAYIETSDLFNTLQVNNVLPDIYKLKNTDNITFDLTNKYGANIYLDEIELDKNEELVLNAFVYKNIDMVKDVENKLIKELTFKVDDRLVKVNVMITTSPVSFLEKCRFIASEYETVRI